MVDAKARSEGQLLTLRVYRDECPYTRRRPYAADPHPHHTCDGGRFLLLHRAEAARRSRDPQRTGDLYSMGVDHG